MKNAFEGHERTLHRTPRARSMGERINRETVLDYERTAEPPKTRRFRRRLEEEGLKHQPFAGLREKLEGGGA